MRPFPLLVFLAATILIPLPAHAAADGVAVIGYHEVAPDPSSGWAVRTEDFNEQIEYLATTGYHVISVDELYDYISGKLVALPSHPVVITVDDGWRGAYTDVAPVLRKHRYPWSLYVYPAIVGVGAEALSWPQVLELQSAGVAIEGHTTTHAHLMHRTHPEMNGEQYAAWLHDELAGSKAIIESHTGKPVRYLAYPYGDHDGAVEAEARRDGYLLGLTSEIGLNTPKTDPMQVKRFAIISDTTVDQLRAALGAKPVALTALSPADGSVLASGETMSATIANRTELVPQTIHIALLSGEPATAKYDHSTGRISLSLANAPRSGREEVVIWGDGPSGQRYASVLTYYSSSREKTRYAAMRAKLLDLPLHHTDKTRHDMH